MSRTPSLSIGAAAGAAGLLLGLLAGWLLFAPPAVPPPSPAPRGRVEAAPAPSAGPGTGGGADAGGRIAFRPPPPEPARPAGEPSEPAGETARVVDQLRQQLSQLEKKLAVEGALAQQKQGVPIKAPEHLDARFDQESVRSAVNAGLKEAGFDGEVTAVDCSEYPCLAVGELKGSHFGPDESERLTKSSAMSDYGKDSKLSFGSSSDRNGQGTRNLFGIAMYPKSADTAEQQQIDKRLRYRFDEIQGL